jgi:hypothetical protein
MEQLITLLRLVFDTNNIKNAKRERERERESERERERERESEREREREGMERPMNHGARTRTSNICATWVALKSAQ